MLEPKTRRPVAAGQFYPSSAAELRRQIGSFVDKQAKRRDCVAAMLPHAGYVYSGRVAVETLSRVNIKERVILLGPNHTGLGASYAIEASGSWQTPLGEVEIDNGLAEEILKRSDILEEDRNANAREHSLEVELPLLQYFKTDFKFVPLLFLSDELEALRKVGQDIAEAVIEKKLQDSTLIVASSDMTHYEPGKTARAKDNEAIQAILELDEEKLMRVVRRLNVTMCGFAPAIAMIKAAKALGAKKGELVKYQTSAEVTGDDSSVVGYAGIIIY